MVLLCRSGKRSALAAQEAAKAGLTREKLGFRVEREIPFDSTRKMMSVIAARQSGVAGEAGFTLLIQHAATAMPFIAASVQGLVFENGELQLTLLADGRKPADHAWQATLAEAGIQASASDAGWTLRPMAAAPTPDAPKEVDDE